MIEYKDSDVVKVRVVPYVDSYVVPCWEVDPNNPKNTGSPSVLGKASDGPFEIETTGRSVRDVLLDVEPEPDAWESAQRRFGKAKDRYRSRMFNDSAVKQLSESDQEETVTVAVNVWCFTNSAAKLFFESEGRSCLPVGSIEVIENRGPRFDDHKSRMDENKEFMDLMKQKMKMDIRKEMAEMQAETDKATAPKKKVTK